MTCSELAEQYELYALGVLEDPELAELHEHLGRKCEVCTAGVRRAAMLMPVLAGAAPDAEPPANLRGRGLASVGILPPFRWNWMQTWATAAAAVVLLLLWTGPLRPERIQPLALADAMEQGKQSATKAI